MKIRFAQAALGLLVLSFSSCAPDVDFDETAADIISERRWTVDHYYEAGDQTAAYAPYTLHFAAGGQVTVSSSGSEGVGQWSIIHDERRQEVVVLEVESAKAELNELAGQWEVSGKSPDAVLLTNRGDKANLFRLRRSN